MAVSVLYENDERGFLTACDREFAYVRGVTNNNGFVTAGTVFVPYTNPPCQASVVISNSPPTNFMTIEVFCDTVIAPGLIPAARPFIDYFPETGTLVFEDYQMSADILPIVLPGNLNVFIPPTNNFVLNKSLRISIDSVALDPLESTDIKPPEINAARAVADMNILDTDTVPGSCGVRTNILFNFAQSAARCTENVNGFNVARVWVERTGFDGTQSGSVQYRIDFGPPANANNAFSLQAGSDYATPTNAVAFSTFEDFESVTGTLNWGANDFQPKVIEIPISDDQVVS